MTNERSVMVSEGTVIYQLFDVCPTALSRVMGEGLYLRTIYRNCVYSILHHH